MALVVAGAVIPAAQSMQTRLFGPAEAAARWAPADAGRDVQAFGETRQSLLQTEQRLPIHPAAIVTNDEGLIVAGYTGEQAWAAMTDAAGKVLWTYEVDKPAGYDKYPWLQVRPEFRCATSMPDGSVWLFGSTIESGAQVGLLVHLDRHGKVLESRTARPPSGPSTRAPTNLFDTCARLGDGIAVVGSTSVRAQLPASSAQPAVSGVQLPASSVQLPASSAQIPASRLTTGQPEPLPGKPAFWILILDANGHAVSEDVIPTGQERALGGSSAAMTVLSVGGEAVVVSAQTGADTELLRFGLNDHKTVQKHYANASLSLVRPVVPDGRLQLFGSLPNAGAGKRTEANVLHVLLTLDDALEQLRREDVRAPFVSNVTYRMPDQSLVMFGAQVHDMGEEFTSQIVHVNPTLQNRRSLRPDRAKLTDTGMIYTAVPSGPIGQFVLATVAVVKGFPDHPAPIDAPPGFLRGAVLDFVELSP